MKVARRVCIQISSTYEVFDLLAVTIISEKIHQDIWGGWGVVVQATTPFPTFWVPQKQLTTHLKNLIKSP